MEKHHYPVQRADDLNNNFTDNRRTSSAGLSPRSLGLKRHHDPTRPMTEAGEGEKGNRDHKFNPAHELGIDSHHSDVRTAGNSDVFEVLSSEDQYRLLKLEYRYLKSDHNLYVLVLFFLQLGCIHTYSIYRYVSHPSLFKFLG